MPPVKVKRLSQEAREALSRATIQGDDLLLLPEALPRPVYVNVNDMLLSAGAKWHKGRKGHVFSVSKDDLLAMLENAVENGTFSVPLDDFFPTPGPLAAAMAAFVSPDDHVLEPSAGDGALLREILPRVSFAGRVTAVESNFRRANDLRERFGEDLRIGGIYTEDFLTFNPPLAQKSETFHSRKFDAVIMNPPFSRRADLRHVARAMDLLKTGGVLVAIMGAGVTFREDQLTKRFVRWLEDSLEEVGQNPGCLASRVAIPGVKVLPNQFFIKLPEGTFSSAGTEVNTVLLCGRKRAVPPAPFAF